MHLLRNHHFYAIISLCISAHTVSAKNFEFLFFADYYGGIELAEGYKNLRSRIFVHPKFFGKEDKTGLEWQLSAKLWAQPLGNLQYIPLWDILDESYVFIPFNYFDITVGQKNLTYGFADVFGPLNVPQGRFRASYSLDDPFDTKLPDPMIQLRFYPTLEDTIEFVYIPITRPDRERYDNVKLSDSNDIVQWDKRPYITNNLHSFFVNYSRYGEKVDLQFFYGWYTSSTPDFAIHEATNKQSTFLTTYRKKHVFGFAYSTRIWNATLSQDLAFNLTSDLDGLDIGAQNSDITLNTQLLVNLPWNILSQFSLVYAFFPNHEKHNLTGMHSNYLAKQVQAFHTQPQQHILFLVIHLEKSFLREKLKTTLNYGFFFSLEMYFGPRISYAINDYWQLNIGADLTLGRPPDTDLRRNPSNDNFYVRLLYEY